jgi:hypothetical protein
MTVFGADLQDVLSALAQPLLDPTAGPQPRASTAPSKVWPKTNWQVIIGQNNIGPQYELSTVSQRALSYHMTDSANMTFVMDGSDPALKYIVELVTDVWLYRNGILMFRGRIGSSQDSLDGEADTYTVTITAFDYREWLARQLLQPSRKWSWRNQTQAQIIRDIFTYCISGQSGIHPTFTIDTIGMPSTKVNFDTTAGTSVKEVIGVMAGFGWQVFPNSNMGITLKAMSPFYYQYNDNFVLEYGGSVSKVTRSLDTGAYANSVVYTGDMNLAPVQKDVSGIGTSLQGRLGLCLSNPSIVDTAHLATAAQSAANNQIAIVPQWSCELAPGHWQSSADAWIGDICKFVIRKNRLVINDSYRITDIDISINDDSTKADGLTFTIQKPASLPPRH